MLKFTSVSASVRAITEDITLTGTIIRTGITPDLIIDPITGRTTDTDTDYSNRKGNIRRNSQDRTRY